MKLAIGLIMAWLAAGAWAAVASARFADDAKEIRGEKAMAEPVKQKAVHEEQPLPFHGLTELAKRRGWRRLSDTERDGVYLSERTVFRDSATGATAWRMTCDPAVDVGDYYDIPAWNADGSLIAFLSRRAGGGRQRWLMDANGARIRPFPAPGGKPIDTGYWSVIHPDRFYHPIKDETGTRVVATNPYTGEEQTVVSVARDLGEMQPPHPSEKWFLFGDRQERAETGAKSTAHVVALDGSVRDVPLEKRWHRLRFTRSPDARLFFNFDDPRQQFTILPDGSGRTSIPDPGGHPDWLAGGKELTYYNAGAIWAIRYDGTGKRCILAHGGGGHGGPTQDGEWFVSDTSKAGKFPSSILYLRTDGSQVCHTVFKHMSSYLSHSSTWHPDSHSTHPHPVASPDGTKVLFNSDFLGQYTDIYVAVSRPPDPPRDLTARTEGGSVVLKWNEPRRCHETAGYVIYRGAKGGPDYQRMTPRPIAGTEWRGPAAAPGDRYVATAVEHSGLESGPSNEARAEGNEPSRETARPAVDTTPPPAPTGLQTAPVSPNTLRITWAKADANDVDRYNVYCGPGADFACAQASLIGSPSETEMVDWGLEVNATYYYKVSAVDRAGNESAPSPAVMGRTPPFEPARIALKPETATAKDMALEDVAEAGGKVLKPAEKGKGEAVWEFEIPRDGEYAIWARSTHSAKAASGFELSMDGGKDKISCRIYGRWEEWHWSPAGMAVAGSPQLFTFRAGRHTVKMRPRTPTAFLAGIVITDDPMFPGKNDDNGHPKKARGTL